MQIQQSNDVSLKNTTFLGNFISGSDAAAIVYGGAVYVFQVNGFSISNSRFVNCTIPLPSNGTGGAVAIKQSTGVTVTNTSFTLCSALSSGALAISNSNAVTVTNTSFINTTTAGDGGGLLLSVIDGASVVDCIFTMATAQYGGGMSVESSDDVYIQGCRFTSCNAVCVNNTGGGGALSVLSGNEITFIQSTISTCRGCQGGGLFLETSNSTIESISLINNSASFHGGGLYSSFVRNISVSNSNFSGNLATDGSGGGAFFASIRDSALRGISLLGNIAANGDGGAMAMGASDFIVNVTLDSIQAFGNRCQGNGGAIWWGQTSTSKLDTCSFHSNTAGGQAVTHGALTVIDSSGTTIRTSSRAGGGGLYIDGYSNVLVVMRSVFDGNVATIGDGGALSVGSAYGLTTNATLLTGNKASSGRGGGFFIVDSSGLTATNLTVTYNTCGQQGGGMYFDFSRNASGSEQYLIRSTVSYNTGTGVLLTGGTLFIDDGCFLGNQPRSFACQANAVLVFDTTASNYTAIEADGNEYLDCELVNPPGNSDNNSTNTETVVGRRESRSHVARASHSRKRHSSYKSSKVARGDPETTSTTAPTEPRTYTAAYTDDDAATDWAVSLYRYFF
eukprot:TRINITY_DN1050_c0_g1_i1.p1 TRINITY_DN1050_c0_g1~~TRINITY_DN1050_c0_g1_i1.p1  ORF type:complete len:619 (+),score=63.90 TRINITY_DN1050_c0_g1_i1:1087-2943(+)